MKKIWTNATVLWSEAELVERDSIVASCLSILREKWCGVNPAVKFCRVETPILTPPEVLKSHVAEGFPMLSTAHGLLRPETTGGTIAAFLELYPQSSQRKKLMPICIWQWGKSFRDETNPSTMRASRLRLREFHQLEFQLFAPHGTKCDYIDLALDGLIAKYGGVKVEADELPHYSECTTDWEIEGIEVAGCSKRKDFPDGELFEISIGLDRLLKLQTKYLSGE